MSSLDKPSSGDSGAERADWSDDRPFPGAPLDRPPVEEPDWDSVRSWDEIKADPAAYEAALKELHAVSGPSDVPESSSRDSAPKATDEPGRTGATDAESVGEKERAGDVRADTSGDDDAEALRQEIATLKSDNAHHKAEIETLKSEITELKSEITEIKEALREKDRESGPESSDARAAEGQASGEHEEHKPGDKGVITHFHGKDLDLYTDGTRWVSGDALKAAQGQQEHKPEASRHEITEIPGVRDQGRNVVGEKADRSPGDTSDLPPTGEQLLETDEHLSRADAFRRKSYEEENLEDVNDIVHDDVDLIDKLFDRPPASSHAEVPVHHAVYEPADTQHANTNDLVMGSLVASIVVVEGVRAASHKVQNLKDATHEMMERHRHAGD